MLGAQASYGHFSYKLICLPSPLSEARIWLQDRNNRYFSRSNMSSMLADTNIWLRLCFYLADIASMTPRLGAWIIALIVLFYGETRRMKGEPRYWRSRSTMPSSIRPSIDHSGRRNISHSSYFHYILRQISFGDFIDAVEQPLLKSSHDHEILKYSSKMKNE